MTYSIEGRPDSVFVALFEKKRLIEAGLPHAHIRPLLLILGGAYKGVYGGGAVCALREAGLGDVFDTVVGISTGAPTAAYFLSGQPEVGTSIYYEECVRRPFISLRRGLVRKPMADVPYLAQVFRGEVGTKALDKNAILASRTNLYVTATHYFNGKPEFLNAKKSRPDIVEAISESISIPVVSSKKPRGHDMVTDGSVGNPFPIERLVHEHKPTHVMILPNVTEEEGCSISSRTQQIFKLLSVVFLPKKLSTKMRLYHRMFTGSLNWMRSDLEGMNVSWVIVWPDNEVGLTTQDPQTLKSAAFRSREFLLASLQPFYTFIRGGAFPQL